MKVTENLLFKAVTTAYKAGVEIMQVYEYNDFKIEKKADQSPVTLADKRAHDKIINLLNETQIPILSEEDKAHSYSERKDRKLFWLVDPLDGTKEFIKKNGEFTVNIALVDKNTPIMGVIYVPNLRKIYFGDKLHGAFVIQNLSSDYFDDKHNYESLITHATKLPLPQTKRKYRVVVSRSHLSQATKDFLQNLEQKHNPIETVSIGSSLKMCIIAEGNADIYPRFSPTMEWDIAAGHAILTASGASISQPDGKPLLYNKEHLRNPFFIAKRNL